MSEATPEFPQEIERQEMVVDIACVGFGPAMGGFLTTLTREMAANPGEVAMESKAAPGMPLQVLCYERADDISAGVSGVVTRGKAIRESFPELNPSEIPMAVPVKQEKVLYLLDPIGASRRGFILRAGDAAIRALRSLLPVEHDALDLPFTPEFLQKHGGLLMSVGQFNQWVGGHLMTTGLAQVWPGTPVSTALFDGKAVVGVRLADQGVDRQGNPDACYMPGMDVRAQLTVVGDGPVGAVGRSINEKLGMPNGHAQHEWAVGMKIAVELPEDTPLEAGTVWHMFGYPEPEIFGFLYVHPDRLASVGIFVPSWLANPTRSSYRYLQHFMEHPYLWRYLKDGTMRSWGAKSLQESGLSGEPFLAGDGFARIGEGSGSTNMLTGSGVDEAWATGVQLAEAVAELLRAGKPFSRENLEAAYVQRRRASWVNRGAEAAKNARTGFHIGMGHGLAGMAVAGLTSGKLSLNRKIPPAHKQIDKLKKFYSARLKPEQIQKAISDAAAGGRSLHDALMNACGWPEIEYDGKLLVPHQDALLMGGKVQAASGFADHVIFRNPQLCVTCEERTCIAMCSGQAITQGEGSVPAFDREKCVHCGACLWNCTQSPDGENSNIEFRAGAGGLHSAEN
ncbi:MAG: 4Fe-4S ferredoxin [Acidobacteria bacterium]|nr:MAG: 4Fe-4S ferredoxin [Acidobacteriota bacterium]